MPRLLFLAIGFPPALKSNSYRVREIANAFAAAGWSVTVVNAAPKVWEDEFGLDHSLLEGVDPSIRIVELPLERADLETDIRTYPEARAQAPGRWVRRWREENIASFPEPNFGGWRDDLEQAVLELHAEEPFDLTLASCVPYVQLAAALRLHEEHGVPYAVDFRDGWSIDVVGGGPAFEDEDAPELLWERRALESAISLWLVNEPIAAHYREMYPELADQVHVVRNGFDLASIPDLPSAPSGPLRFGYLGTINFRPEFVDTLLDAWRAARESDPLMASATWEWRGNLGAGASRGTSRVLELLVEASDQGIRYGGPVPKNEVSSVYDSWDALTLMIIGGAYMTSGKVYECMATGLPILSAHAVEHDASTLLGGYPLWTGAGGLDHDFLVSAFKRAASLAVHASPEQRTEARTYARQYERQRTISQAVESLIEGFVAR